MSESILEVKNISYSYSNTDSKSVLNEISFDLAQGEFLTLLGPNGCGKSTLMKTVAGIISLNRTGCGGQVRYRGKDFLSEAPSRRARMIAYIGFDFRSEFPITSYDAVMVARTAAGSGFIEHMSAEDREVVQWAMERCHCWSWRDRDLQAISGGERQLVGLARALAQGAKILFLDESLSQMDLNHQSQIGGMLKELTSQGWSVVLVSHDVNLAAEWAHSALLLKSGERIVRGRVRDVLTEENLRLLYPGADLIIGPHPTTGSPKVFFGKRTR